MEWRFDDWKDVCLLTGTADRTARRTLAHGECTLIPDLIDGVLPEGIHRCTFDEVARRFGRFQTSDQRWKLTKALSGYLKEVKALDVAAAVIIDGSYVTMKAEPNDIDLILVLRRNFESEREVAPAEYNVTSMSMVKRRFGIDLRTVAPDSPRYTDYLEFFSRVRSADLNVRTTQTRKGVLSIDL